MTLRSLFRGVLFSGFLSGGLALAFVGFVTVSERERVYLTIYKGADLTLVQDIRRAVMKAGRNSFRYQWFGTLIDPTSLRIFPPSGVEVDDTTYPLADGESLIWNLNAREEVGGELGIQYFTSGLTWQADHRLVMTDSEKGRLETWIKVGNNSGEPYEESKISLVVGEVRLVETIRTLAERFMVSEDGDYEEDEYSAGEAVMDLAQDLDDMKSEKGYVSPPKKKSRPMTQKEVVRESLSELHLYRIDGTESVPDKGARRMRAFAYPSVEVKDVFRCEDPTSKQDALRVVTLENNKENKMGTQPLPEGELQVYRERAGGLSFEGRGPQPYTPIGELSETDLGRKPSVFCETKAKNVEKSNLDKDALGRIRGWDEKLTADLKLVNGEAGPAEFEVRYRVYDEFKFTMAGAEKEDKSTLLFKTKLKPFESKTIPFTVTRHKGTRAEKN